MALTEYIIVWTTDRGPRYVRTQRGRWCSFFPAVNEHLWMKFGTKEQAESYLNRRENFEGLPDREEALQQMTIEEWRT